MESHLRSVAKAVTWRVGGECGIHTRPLRPEYEI